jgi:hypothetical protein
MYDDLLKVREPPVQRVLFPASECGDIGRVWACRSGVRCVKWDGCDGCDARKDMEVGACGCALDAVFAGMIASVIELLWR